MDGIDFGVPPFFRLEIGGQKGAKNSNILFVPAITLVLVSQLLWNLSRIVLTIKERAWSHFAPPPFFTRYKIRGQKGLKSKFFCFGPILKFFFASLFLSSSLSKKNLNCCDLPFYMLKIRGQKGSKLNFLNFWSDFEILLASLFLWSSESKI